DHEGDGPIVNGELDFDGWEDVPPALPVSQAKLGNIPSPQSDDDAALHNAIEGQPSLPVGRQSAIRPRLYSVPTIFDEEDEEPDEFPPAPAPALPIPPA